jgi:hypothetical protein
VVDVPQRVLAGGRHRQAGEAERPQQVGLGVGVESRLVQRGPDLVGERLQTLRADTGRWTPTEHLREDLVVHLGAPGHAVVVHLGGDQRPGRLGGQEQAQAPGLVGPADGVELAAELCEGVGVVRRRRHVVEERRPCHGGRRSRGCVPRSGCGPGEG